LPLPGQGFLGNDVSDFTLSIAFTSMLLATRVIAETVLIREQWYPYYLLAIKRIMLSSLTISPKFSLSLRDFLFMAFLIDLAFAVQ
jgi:hypothetical protein